MIFVSEYMEHFNMSSEFYSFNQFNVHFLIMSTELPYELGSNQYEFVKSDLENSSKKFVHQVDNNLIPSTCLYITK